MRRFFIMILILFCFPACWCFFLPLLQVKTNTVPTASITTPTMLPGVPSSTITSTSMPPPTQTSATQTPAPTFTPPSSTFTVIYHPDGVLYAGDQVSFEVISPPGVELKDARVQVQVDPPNGPVVDPVSFTAWGIQGRQEATLLWAWDTANQYPGSHSLAFSVDPGGYAWTEQVTLQPAEDMPPSQANAHWSSTQTACCTVFYITRTASERDLSTLIAQVDEQARLSIEEMDSSFTDPITITILPRLLGHGGFTSDEISVSYLDRNYAANDWAMVLHHEMIHVLDAHLGGDFRPTIFVEGLAVYMTGGHYKPEPLMPRAAALLAGNLNWYIPLKTLADDFYASQHEIGYLEGSSLIEYMVASYGWDAFSAFYRDIHIKPGESQSEAIQNALQAHFSTSLDELERGYLTALANQPDATAWMDDVRLTVTYFDTLRRYQQLLDPSAYFRTAWLMDNKTMRQRGIVADYLRHPGTPTNLALETLLLSANQKIADLQFAQAARRLDEINSVLDSVEQGKGEPFSQFPEAADYLSIASTLQAQGYEVQRLVIDGTSATAEVTTPAGPDLLDLQLIRSNGNWSVSP